MFINFEVYFVVFTVPFAVTAVVLFDPYACTNGCLNDDNCPDHALCLPVVTNSDCGICLCNDGYITNGDTCQPKKSVFNERDALSSNQILHDPVIQIRQTYPASLTTPIPILPPQTSPINCSLYNCEWKSNGIQDDSSNTFEQGALQNCNDAKDYNVVCQTPIAGNDRECFGVYCLIVNTEKSYCICPYDRIGDGCHESKPGKCSSGTGLIPKYTYRRQNYRYVNSKNPDHGSILARHFARSLADCIKLCQWTEGQCKSVNFGTINKRYICELLSVQVNRSSPLRYWLKSENDWDFVCMF